MGLDVHTGKNQELIAGSSSDRLIVTMRYGTSVLQAEKSQTQSVFQWLIVTVVLRAGGRQRVSK